MKQKFFIKRQSKIFLFLVVLLLLLIAFIGVGCVPDDGECTGCGASKIVATNSSYWNEYYKTNTDNTLCNASSDGPYYTACYNAGEYRKSTFIGLSSCSGITAKDVLEAFEWQCLAGKRDNEIEIQSTGLKESKGLSDLIDFDTGTWLQNAIIVYKDGEQISKTSPAIWYDNPIKTVNNGGSLTDAKTIYIITQDPYATYTIENNQIALLVKPGLKMHGPQSSAIPIFARGYDFLWVEGAIDAQNDDYGVFFSAVRFSMIRNMTVKNTGIGSGTGPSIGGLGIAVTQGSYHNIVLNAEIDTCKNHCLSIAAYGGATSNYNIAKNINARGSQYYNINVDSSDYNKLYNIRSVDGKTTGIALNKASNNLLYNTISSNNSTYGLLIAPDSKNNLIINTTVFNNTASGVMIYDNLGSTFTKNNLLLGISSFNSPASGILLQDNATDNLLINVATSNNQNGIWIADGGAAATDNTIYNLLSTNNVSYGVTVDVNSVKNGIKGVFKVGVHGISNCMDNTVGKTTFGGPGNDCTIQGAYSGYILTQNVNTTSAFEDKIISDDTKNTVDSNGQLLYDSITDWFKFENSYRGWGLNHVDAFPSPNLRGQCTTGNTCRIFGWSLLSSDTRLLNVFSTELEGNSSNTITHIWSDGTSTTFLKNAIEVMFDNIGDDDGLCESNETCIHTPNLGAYQGHGSLESAGSFTNGNTLTGITLQKYSTNGY